MQTPPKLHRRSYWEWLNDPANPDVSPDLLEAVSVEVTYADQLRGELEVAKQGITMDKAPMTTATVWVWCAMVRTKLYANNFATFKNSDLAGMEPITTPDDEESPDPT
jgi:hypothetical protein